MKSEMAEADLQKMMADGLKPTIDDIIRLNALGLKCERSQRGAEFFALPRVAFLGSLAFREPTIGHGIWIDDVSRFADKEDVSTRVAIDAFALSRSIEKLPDPTDRKACVDAIDDFVKKELAKFTFAQIACAILYAKVGSSAAANEYPEPPLSDDDDAESSPAHDADVTESVGCGVLFETIAIGLGLSVREISNMTISRAKYLQEVALFRSGIDLSKSNQRTRVAEYYTTREAIVARLKSEGVK